MTRDLDLLNPPPSAPDRSSDLFRHIVDLAGDPDVHGMDFGRALDAICRKGAEALDVAQSGYWTLDPETSSLRCLCLQGPDGPLSCEGLVLVADDYPKYFAAIRDQHVIDAHIAQTDPRTSEFTDGYLRPRGITSMLDVAVRRQGRVVGLLCFEHVGPPRIWTPTEITLGCHLAEQVNLRLRHDQELLEQRRKHETLIASLPGMVFRIRNAPGWPVAFISDGSTELTGWRPDQMIGDREVCHADVVYPDDRDKVWRAMDAALRDGNPYEIEYRIVTRQGAVKWVWEQGLGVHGDDGSLVAAEGFVSDVTRRVEVEAALRQSESRHRGLFDHMWAGVAVYESTDGESFRLADMNRAGERTDHVRREDIVGRDVTEVFPGVATMGLLDVLSRVWRTGEQEHLGPTCYRDGSRDSWRENYVYRIASGEVVSVYEDVTDRVLRERDLRLKTFSLDNANDAVFWVTCEGRFLDVNATACRYYGYSEEEFRALLAEDINPEYTPATFARLWERLRREGPLCKESVHQLRDGRIVPVEASLSLVKFEDQEIMCALIRDIAARKAAEEQVRRLNAELEERVEERTSELASSRERYRLLVESLKDSYVFYSLKGDGSLAYISPSVEQVLGFTPQEYHLVRHERLVDSPVNAQVVAHTDAALQGVHQPPYEAELRHRDGTTRVFEILEVPVCDELGRVQSVEGIARDITQHKRNLSLIQDQQDQLLENEKMAALGRMVAGVAHEINTPVGIGLTAASHFQEKLTDLCALYKNANMKKADLDGFLAEADESVRMIRGNLDRAAQLIQGFKGVAVDQSGEGRRVFDLRLYLDEILLSLRPALKKTRHEVTVNCKPGLLVDSYPGALSHTVTNLVMNSLIHGFEGVERGAIAIAAELAGDEIHLAYSDDGVGMPPEVRRQLYEPFFTTKRSQGGSGLGMHVVYTAVTQTLGGKIACESSPGHGTTFTITFPVNNGSRDVDAE
ncbi:MAG: PAS domain S-box protein [Desulfobacterales bacterium]|nr:PAS domain S-box protein [Desulfobacterales bacterium]